MIFLRILVTSILPIFLLQSLCSDSMQEQLKEKGYIEISDNINRTEAFDSLYASFDIFINFIQINPNWAHKLYVAKDRFIRSKERLLYSTDFFGLYDESKIEGRRQISFYYSIHLHQFICSYNKDFKEIPEIINFFNNCLNTQKMYNKIFDDTSEQLGIKNIFNSSFGNIPILFKVVKYLQSYVPSKPHYDGTAISFLLDSTDNKSLLLSPYKQSYTADDFTSPERKFSRTSIILIPGTNLTEFYINPTPHVVIQSNKDRYATIAFAMRPNYTAQKNIFSALPKI